MNRNTIKVILILAGVHEAFFAVPVLGWVTTVGSSLLFPLFSGLALHGLALYALKQVKGAPEGAPVLGIVASFLALVPIIGWLAHIIATLLYIVTVLALFSPSVVSSKGGASTGGSHVQSKNTQKDRVVRDAEIIE